MVQRNERAVRLAQDRALGKLLQGRGEGLPVPDPVIQSGTGQRQQAVAILDLDAGGCSTRNRPVL